MTPSTAAQERRIDIVADEQGREWFQLRADRPIARVPRTSVVPPHVLTEGLHYEPVYDRSGVRIVGWVHRKAEPSRRRELVALVAFCVALVGILVHPLFIAPTVLALAVVATPYILWRDRP